MVQTEQKKEPLFDHKEVFGSFSANDIPAVRAFYADKLGIDAKDEMGGLKLQFGDNTFFIYPKKDHKPAVFTVLNLPVKDIDIAVEELKSRGIQFESYKGDIETDEKGIFRGADKGNGPNIAWFKDPAGNILSLVETK